MRLLSNSINIRGVVFLAVMMSFFGLLAGAGYCGTTTVSYQVAEPLDDGYATSTTIQSTTYSALLRIGDDNRYSLPFMRSAMRFTNIQVPRHARINSAHLKIHTYQYGSEREYFKGEVRGIIQAEATGNPPNFSHSNRHIGTIVPANAGVNWDHKFVWEPATWYTSPDISVVLQEVVDRPDFSLGNAVVIIYSTREITHKYRAFYSADNPHTYAPKLEITYEYYNISGYVTTATATPIEGAFINAGATIEGDVTDASGYYELKVPPGWSGTVTPSKVDWAFVPASQVYSSVTSDQVNQDYTGFQPKISGYVADGNGVGIEGVLVSADGGGGATITDANGYYEVTVFYNWGGTVTPTKDGWLFDPAERSYSNVPSDRPNEDYTGRVHPYGGGVGTETDPFVIYTAEEMNRIGANPQDWWRHFKLMADIDLSEYTGTSFNIIGTYWDGVFTGVFDGNGHTISNFTYDSNGVNYIGLFGKLVDSEVKNLVLTTPFINAGSGNCVGGLVGYLEEGYIEKCSVEDANISGGQHVGGLVGKSTGQVHECFATGMVQGSSVVGGLVGSNDRNYHAAQIFDSYASGRVTGSSSLGGLLGYNDTQCSVIDSYSTTFVDGSGINVGGLVGESYALYSPGFVFNSFWDVATSGQATSAGGQGKTTSEMMSIETYVGWGCDDAWTIDDGNNYPKLTWENKPGNLMITPMYGGGNGEPNDPYLIYTAEQLNKIGLVYCHLQSHFKLMGDIDLGGFTGTEFNIIGWPDYPLFFAGVFDGNDHAIWNFTYNSEDQRKVGLFGHMYGVEAEIKNLTLIDPNINAGTGSSVGSILGVLHLGNVTNCRAEGGAVMGRTIVGGLVGSVVNNLYGVQITGCSGSVRVECRDDYGGGLVGLIYEGDLYDCISEGDVSGGKYVGGLVGYTKRDVTGCFSTGNIQGNNHVGGLIGMLDGGVLERSFSYGTVTGNVNVGGLVGTSVDHGRISDCYSVSSVEGSNQVGGLAGVNGGYTAITRCYSRGYVSGIDAAGGLIGNKSTWATDSNCFWDVNSSGEPNSAGGTGLSTAQIQTESTFIDAGWDFVGEVINGTDDIWDICEGTNYPKLVWQIPVADFVCPDGVTLVDFSYFAAAWMSDPNQPNWDPICDISEPNDNVINWLDVGVFVENWLAGV